MYDSQQIVFFDGICNLCESSVQFLIKHNKKKNLLFASLQSHAGQEMLHHFGLPQSGFNSFIFLENGKLYKQSTGALRAAKHLSGLWPMFYYIFILIPPFIRNSVYDFVAKNRFKWFGEKNACWMPTPELKQRFLN